jgi:hypothetical protein
VGENGRWSRNNNDAPRVAAFLAAAAVATFLGLAAIADGVRKLSIMAVMQKQYRVSRAPFVMIKKGLDADAPDWEKIQDSTRSFVLLAAALEQNEPRHGTKESWKRLTELHSGDAKKMSDAALARDKETLLAVHKRVAASCKACHDAHRFRGSQGISAP